MSDINLKLAHAVINLGRDDKERARVLGVSQRTITDYKAGKFPRAVLALLEKQVLVLGSNAILPQQDAV